ncbi:MAG: DUF1573 domain-containing protein [Acidobacteria bacterium]|nr:DUF1573 domain-containing protein [Acidobacteriota bacterium]
MYLLLFLTSFSQTIGPKLVAPQPNFAFGQMLKGEKGEHPFLIQNQGDAALVLKNIRTSCGCTTVGVETKRLAPGESFELVVTFDSQSFHGSVEKRVTVESNDPQNPTLVLIFSAQIIADLVCQPELLTLNDIAPGQQKDAIIWVQADQLERLDISEIKAEPAFLKARVQSQTDKSAELVVEIDGRLFPPKTPKLHGSVAFKSNSAAQPWTRIPVHLQVLQPLVAEPDYVSLFGLIQGKGGQARLRLSGTAIKQLSSADLQVEIQRPGAGAESLSDYFQINFLEADSGKTLELVVKPEMPQGRFVGRLLINTHIAEWPTVLIPVRGNVQ